MIRNNSIFISEEVTWMLHQVRRAMYDKEGTIDMLADGFLREVLTTRWPQLVELRAEFEKAVQSASKSYRAIEDKVSESLNGTPTPRQQSSPLANREREDVT